MSAIDTTAVIQTVTGPLAPQQAGIIDGHTHVWIDAVAGVIDPQAPVLASLPVIMAGLRAYCDAGGGALIDCQPQGCGRNGNMLLRLSQVTGTPVVAATGFHRRRYYPPDAALFTASVDQACQLFMNELTQNLHETRSQPQPVRAGFIKIAFEASLQDTPLHLAEAAVLASHETDSAVEVHTEKGAAAEEIARFLLDAGLPASRLILCHMDKRPDFDLHSSLAEAGIALEYDTFLRPHYRPDDHVWPLLARMIGAGLEDYVILATDMADIRLWSQAAGAAALPTSIVPRLRQMGLAPGVIQKLTGLNIARRLARRDSAGIL